VTSILPIACVENVRAWTLASFGLGRQTRDFTYVADVVEANIFAATHEFTGVYNAGRGATITICKLADIVRSVTGSKSPVVNLPQRPGDIYASQAGPSRLEREGFSLRTTLEEGIERTTATFK
jgi:UDP-glucose 4-epimerase